MSLTEKVVICCHFLVVVIVLKLLHCMFFPVLQSTYLFIGYAFLFFFIAAFSFSFTKRKYLNDRIPTENKAVFITGCDTGFGNLLAMRLDSKGYHVFAGCLQDKGAGAQELRAKCSKRLHLVPIDVSSDSSVQSAFEYVKSELGQLELWAVVNNADIAVSFFNDFTSIEDYKATLDVNCLGYVRVTKAFLPLLYENKGRIVNMTSMLGRLVSEGTSYVTTMHGVIGFNDCLRHELRAWGIPVISVEPGFFKTPLNNPSESRKRFEKMLESLEPDIRNDYGEDYLSAMSDYISTFLVQYASPKLHRVINCLEEAVGCVHPEPFYKPKAALIEQILVRLYFHLPSNLKCALITFVIKIIGFNNIVPDKVNEYKQNC